MGGRYENHESSNRDCLLILEQSERIEKLESAMQTALEMVESKAHRHIDICIWLKKEFKPLLEKGK